MAHVRIYISTEAFNRLRDIAGRNGRAIPIEAGLVLEAALRGVTLPADGAPTQIAINRAERATETKP